MTVVPNLLDQDRKAFPFLRGEFLSDISITIVMASDGATRRHAVALSSRYKRATQAYLGLPSLHWKLLRTNTVQERANHEIKRESRAVQMFSLMVSLVRLNGVVVCERDEIWQESRGFLEARKMLKSGLGLEDNAKAAWDIKCIPESRAPGRLASDRHRRE